MFRFLNPTAGGIDCLPQSYATDRFPNSVLFLYASEDQVTKEESILCRRLQREGFHIENAHSVQGAMECLQRFRYDLVVLPEQVLSRDNQDLTHLGHTTFSEGKSISNTVALIFEIRSGYITKSKSGIELGDEKAITKHAEKNRNLISNRNAPILVVTDEKKPELKAEYRNLRESRPELLAQTRQVNHGHTYVHSIMTRSCSNLPPFFVERKDVNDLSLRASKLAMQIRNRIAEGGNSR